MASEKRRGRNVYISLGNCDSLCQRPGAFQEEPSAVADAKLLARLVRQKLA